MLAVVLIKRSQCGDVRLGADGSVQCQPPGTTLVDVSRVILTHFLSHDIEDEQFLLYSSGTNRSTDKYILSADFSVVTITNVAVRDEGEYSCQVFHNAFEQPSNVTSETNITAYGKNKTDGFITCVNIRAIHECK